MSDRPHCKDCKHVIKINDFGYIDCRQWGAILGYNNANDCPDFERKVDNE